MKGSRRLLLCFLVLFIGCTEDYSIVSHQETAVIVDSFIQVDMLKELDVLISLDTSGSMNDNFDDVAIGMELLRSDIEGLTTDYRFGYVTMDPSNLGYVGPYDSSSSAIDMLMAPNLLPSTGPEEGFAATYTFLNSDEGYEFSRPEADFLLFLISDEDEQSNITAQIFQEWLQDKFSGVDHDVVVITQLEGSNCGWTYDVGHKYEELAGYYNKSAIDICEEDWSVWLSESSYITQKKDSIVLSEENPILDSMIVYIDHNIINDWSYTSSTNTVQLEFVPDYGSLVEVGYNVYVE